jgi:3-carboxy-cis,cis-muconate cycloisomerase
MKPFSLSFNRSESGLFGPVFSRGPVAREVSDNAFLQAMLDTEAALARALARAGLVSAEAAEAVTEAALADSFEIAELSRGSAEAGNPVPALVRALAAALPREAADAVHFGATSQDIIDTAFMLVSKRSLLYVLSDLSAAAEACAALAEEHRTTVMIGRTLLTPALPVTFGLKAALWLQALDRARARLGTVFASLPVQFGGAAGTLASLGTRGLEVSRLLAEEVGLTDPTVPWHTFRLPVIDLAAALSAVSTVFGKVARDTLLLSQPEIGEIEVPGESGGSSTMPHKKNPIEAVAVLGCTRRVPGLLATLVAASEHEHERAAGGWHAEWETLSDLLRLVGSAAAWGRELVEGLRVDVARMRQNLDATEGSLVSERIATALTPELGRLGAQALVRRAARIARDARRPLIDVLFDDDECRFALSKAGLDRARVARELDPATYLGSADALIDRALAAHREKKGEPRDVALVG